MTILQAMENINDLYMKEGIAPYYINCGYCYEWAEQVEALLKNESFSVELWEIVFGYGDTSHAFLYVNGKFYDAECLSGVEQFMSLPIFSKLDRPQPVWRINSNEKGIGYPSSRINFTKEECLKYYLDQDFSLEEATKYSLMGE